jgi:hypothetical protein
MRHRSVSHGRARAGGAADEALEDEHLYPVLPVLHELFRELWLVRIGMTGSPFRYMVMAFAAGRCWTDDKGFKRPSQVHNITAPLKWVFRAFLWYAWHVLDLETEMGEWPGGFPEGAMRVRWGSSKEDGEAIKSMDPLLDYLYTDSGARLGKSIQTPFHAVTLFNSQASTAAKHEVRMPTCIGDAFGMGWRLTTATGTVDITLDLLRQGLAASEERLFELIRQLCAGTSLQERVLSKLLDPQSK